MQTAVEHQRQRITIQTTCYLLFKTSGEILRVGAGATAKVYPCAWQTGDAILVLFGAVSVETVGNMGIQCLRENGKKSRGWHAGDSWDLTSANCRQVADDFCPTRELTQTL